MADISDILTALASTLGGAIYPNSTAQPSLTGAATRIYPGWPIPQNLDKDLLAGTVNVSIYPLPTERTESMLNLDAVTQSVSAAGTVLTVSGNQVTVSGTPVVGDVAVVYANAAQHAYAILPADTLNSIASALAALIGGTVSGSVVTAAGGTFALSAWVSTPATMINPMERISRQIQVTVWANTPALRDSTAKAVRNALWNAERLAMSDGTSCGISYKSSPMTDGLEKANLYRRDIVILAEFVSAQSSTAQTVAGIGIGVSTPAISAVNYNVQG